MNKNEIYNFLKKKKIGYEITEHEAVYNMEELAQIDIPYPEADAKNLFVCDDKHNNYYLITTTAKKRVDLKKFKQVYNTRPLRFVSEDEMIKILNLTPGSVTPFGILNDDKCIVKCFIDEEFIKSSNHLIGVHPNDNTATIWLKTEDLIDIIKEHGNEINLVEILEK